MKLDHDFSATELGLISELLSTVCPKSVEELNAWNEKHGITWRFTGDMTVRLEDIFLSAADKQEMFDKRMLDKKNG